MTDPKRVQVRGDLFHGRVPEGAIYVGRAAPGLPASPFRNPFRVGHIVQYHHRSGAHPYEMYADSFAVTSAEQACRLYRDIVLAPSIHFVTGFTAPTLSLIAASLTGADLACWCSPEFVCHADQLLLWANP